MAQEVYPEAEGKPLTWPPPGDQTAQQCILDQIQVRANLILAELADEMANGERELPDLVPDEDVEPPPPEEFDWSEELQDWMSAEPASGYWYQVVQGDNLTSIARRALQAFLAENDVSVADDRRLVVEALNSIECGPLNDGLYGHESAHHYAPHGRGISLNRVHADNASRIASGVSPIRTVTGIRNYEGPGGFLPMIWIPRWSSDAIRDPDGPFVEVEGEGFWPNGLSGSWPPPPFVDLGAVNVPSGGWGCIPQEIPPA